MSHENVETVKRVQEAWKADDLDAFLAEVHPDLEWHPSLEPALEGQAMTYTGHQGARRAWREYRGQVFAAAPDVRIEEIRDLGESVLLLGRLAVIGGTTPIELDTEFGQLFTFRDGKVVGAHDYLSHREALQAAGLWK
jgi:ketosteroid isomerase-like protein